MNSLIVGALATCQFELKRSFSLQRMTSTAGLIAFPPVMLWMVILGLTRSNEALDGLNYVLFMIIFLVALICLLSLLLWATPIIYSELEGKTWAFIAMRPGGRISNYLGKYLTAVLVSFLTCFVSLTLCILVANHYHTMGGGGEPWEKWGILTGVFALACLAYAAILAMLGTWFTKRAMVVGAGYLIGVETVLSAVPAIVGKFTMSYHLRSLGELWLGELWPDSRAGNEMLYGPAGPVWMHLTVLGSATIIALVIGCLIVVNRQYVVESD